ncbi:hypothetical protein [Methyloceanibacter caenitepidi]|uniref:Uncharacterized protein n=1 Tax=Methyloceanibacter caenitepidi TaxID=1384459 RepID=A0A0A8K234_9HYPH|nr:hypothetical protein [Methyloceanibacter caenitepidi]BAQ16059.1 hypothetical protein GL4_0596 [Methyloceanibacter caenitepidi]
MSEVSKHIEKAVKAAQEAAGIPRGHAAKAIEAALPHLDNARMAARRQVGREQQRTRK